MFIKTLPVKITCIALASDFTWSSYILKLPPLLKAALRFQVQ
jgi:hypothetical protein